MIPPEGGGVAPGINEDDGMPGNEAIKTIEFRISSRRIRLQELLDPL